MCGIVGLVGRPLAEGDVEAVLGGMCDAVRHRGPDDRGLWYDAEGHVAFGHRRLSILDLSPEGHQPMRSASGRYVITYNGEVYNFQALRRELEARGAAFRGTSDTEVILAAVEAWGCAEATRRFRGIFAFALWDRRERTLTLVRDHLGVKPLYYAFVHGALAFASELRPIERLAGFDATLDRDAIALLLRFGNVPAPYTVYAGVRKLPPGTMATWRPGSAPTLEPVAYWSALEVASAGAAAPAAWDDAEAAERLDALLREVIGRQMLADVPLGAFLSGGIDSSTVVALMQRLSSQPVRTFSIGSEDREYDEAGHAARVARHLGTAHTELVVSAQDALAVVPRLPEIYDEPFADSSQLPTYLVSALARRHVTVALSGDGGDELFGGYNRHVLVEPLWARLRRVPRPVRAAAAAAAGAIDTGTWTAVGRRVRGDGVQARLGEKVHKLAGLLDAPGPETMYIRLLSHWREPARVVLGAREPALDVLAPARWPRLPSLTEQMMAQDLVGYLPDDILTKVDRASMAVALEARVPLLDPDVVEFAWRLPLRQKIRPGEGGKWLLRQVLHRYVPRELVDRPKAGFAVPVGAWLRGPLREWAAGLLDPARLAHEGIFAPALVTRAWEAHQRGRGDLAHRLWTVLMFQAWHETRRTTG